MEKMGVQYLPEIRENEHTEQREFLEWSNYSR